MENSVTPWWTVSSFFEEYCYETVPVRGLLPVFCEVGLVVLLCCCVVVLLCCHVHFLFQVILLSFLKVPQRMSG